MALICMAIFSTDTNGRLEYTKRTLASLLETVDFNRHRLGLYLNSPSDDCIEFINQFEDMWDELFPKGNLIVIANPENIGTAGAINALMAKRNEGELCCKVDDDMIIHKVGWLDDMEYVIGKMPQIGVLGLKRRDLDESPTRTDWAKSVIYEVPHEKGEIWRYVERCRHVMGSVNLYSPAYMMKVGALVQPSNYGMDDSLGSFRSELAGLWNCFLVGIDCEHIDTGHNSPENAAYTKWKQDHAGEIMETYNQMKSDYSTGKTPIYSPI